MLRPDHFRLALALAWILTACQGAPSGPPVVAPPATTDPLAEARTAMTSGEFARSAELLRQVLSADAANLEAHYRLAVSASHLDQAEEARREFQWVVVNGRPDAPEVRIARDWLRRAASPATAVAPGGPQAEHSPTLAGLSGTAVGAADGVPRPMRRMQLFLKGIRATPVEDEAYSLRTGQDGSYRFTGVKPGEYMLTDRVAGPAVWRLKVTLRRGQAERLDLTMDNSIDRRNDFPDYR